MDRRVTETPNEARQGSREGVVRYILAVSIALVVIVFAVIYFVIF